MEAWNFVDYTSLAPLQALNLTTARWGLEPFSANLTRSLNYTGSTHAGPQHTNIIALSHGISALLAILFTAIIMGCGLSKIITPPGPNPENGVRRRHLEHEYNQPVDPAPPRTKQRKKPIQPPLASSSPADQAKEIAHCADLLRQMYALDIQIWSMETAMADEDIAEREGLKHKADALYAEIERIIKDLRAAATIPGAFSPEEQQFVNEIARELDQYGRKGYHGGQLKYAEVIPVNTSPRTQAPPPFPSPIYQEQSTPGSGYPGLAPDLPDPILAQRNLAADRFRRPGERYPQPPSNPSGSPVSPTTPSSPQARSTSGGSFPGLSPRTSRVPSMSGRETTSSSPPPSSPRARGPPGGGYPGLSPLPSRVPSNSGVANAPAGQYGYPGLGHYGPQRMQSPSFPKPGR